MEEIGSANIRKDEEWFIKTVTDLLGTKNVICLICLILFFSFFSGVNVETIHWNMSVDADEFDSRYGTSLFPPLFDARKWKWSNKDALYDISCGDSEFEIVRDYHVKNDIANGVYGTEDVEMD